MSVWHFVVAYGSIGLLVGLFLAAWEFRNRLRGRSSARFWDYVHAILLSVVGWIFYAPMLYKRWKAYVREEAMEHNTAHS